MRLFSLGSNGSGQLGLGHCSDVDSCQEVPLPSATDGDVAVCQIACSSNATALLLSNGQLLISGRVAEMISFSTFTLIPTAEPVAAIFGGWDHLCWISQCDCDKRLVYVLGSFPATNGDVAVESFNVTFDGSDAPCRIFGYRTPFPIAVNSIRSGPRHLLLTTLSQPDTVYGIGDNRDSQISFTDLRKSVGFSQPSPVSLNTCVAATGEKLIDYCASLRHSCFLTSKGNVYITKKKSSPYCIPIGMCNVSFVECRLASSWSSVYLVVRKRRLYSARFKDTDSGFQKLLDLSDDVDFTVGSEHYLIYDRKINHVSAAGWNEHGNCGMSDGQTVGEPQVIFKIPSELQVANVMIKSGYATSFIALT